MQREGQMVTITIGSFKGGTGKTTMSAVLGTALALRGLRTQIIELDAATKPLARYATTREFADLVTPEVVSLNVSGGTPDLRDWQASLQHKRAEAKQAGVDVLIIDTGSVWKPEVVAAHLIADIVLTTVTESPIDLYQFMPGNGPNMQAIHPYAELINLVHRNAERQKRGNFEWALCTNRRSHLRTRVGDTVHDRLADFAKTARVSLLLGLVDRVAYRNMMEVGYMPMDELPDRAPSRSNLAAATEINRLVNWLMPRIRRVEASEASLELA